MTIDFERGKASLKGKDDLFEFDNEDFSETNTLLETN